MMNQDYDKAFIDKITQILEENLENEHFGVRELAEAAAVSRSNLHRKVHAYNGNSTSQFMREYRLGKAIEMLQKNGETVAEVAYKVGFASPTYFNTCFKDHYGFSPGEAKFHESHGVRISGLWKRGWIVFSVIVLILLTGFTVYYWSPVQENSPYENTIDASETSIAVLPLKNWSGNMDSEYISDGMTDAIINRLTRIKSISKVAPFTSVAVYKNTTKSIPIIAKELEVQNILQGNIQISGDHIKINLQLIDGKSDSHIWSHEYAGTWMSDEIFEIQADVAENVAKKLNVRIVNEDVVELSRNPTENKEAYNYWLKARHQYLKYTKEAMQNAVPLFERAISLDSTFLEPHIDLAYLYMFGGASWGLYTEHEAWFKAKEYLLKATVLDSTNHRLNCALNDGLYLYEWDFETMEKNYRENSNIGIFYSLQTGRFDEAMAMINMVYEDYPTSVFFPTFTAQTLYFLGRTGETLEILTDSDKLHSDHIMYLRIASRLYYYIGEYERSQALVGKIINNYPDRPPVVLWLHAANAHELGDLELANESLKRLEDRYKEGKSGSPAWFSALYYSCIGDKENAIKWLQNSYEQHEVEMIWLREEPALRPLRSDTRYKELYNKVGFPMPPKEA